MSLNVKPLVITAILLILTIYLGLTYPYIINIGGGDASTGTLMTTQYVNQTSPRTNISGYISLSLPRNLPKSFTPLNSYEELVNLIERSEALSVISNLGLLRAVPTLIPSPLPPPMPVTVVRTVTVPLVTTLESRIAEVVKSAVTPYSKTNIQVAGVDEADIVKTDGKYIYLASGSNVYVLRAYPPEKLSILHTISLNDEYVKGLFISNNTLVVICEKRWKTISPKPYRITTTTTVTVPVVEVTDTTTITKTLTYTMTRTMMVMPPLPYYRITNTTIHVFVINDGVKEVWNITLSGSYVTSRMIGSILYLISQMPLYRVGDIVPLPVIGDVKVSPNHIAAFKLPDIGYAYTIIFALNVSNLKSKAQVFLLGSSSNVYVSLNNIYILSRKYLSPYMLATEVITEKLISMLPGELKVKVADLMEFIKGNKTLPQNEILKIINELILWFNKLPSEDRLKLLKEIEKSIREVKGAYREVTTIYRFFIKGLDIVAEAVGSVPGVVLDQFSMDEYEGYFRIATTVTKVTINPNGYVTMSRSNNVYILNMNLSIVGKLEDLAMGERVYAARYLGNMMYLVTYRRIDPLFGIDLSDPKNPKVLGYLKIPGYSEYLHPISNKYLIGIGVADEERGVKVSLFDISDPKNIKEVSKVIIKEAFWSPLFTDHKAFLINPIKKYIAFPIYGKIKGLVVIDYSNDTLSLKGIIIHDDCVRSLYIGDHIYSISHSLVRVADDINLEVVKSLNIISSK